MAISKKIRFEVFKRDGFCCAYCGKSPPQVTLEIDHIDPKSKGGKDDMNNLITACFECNRGKKAIRLDKAPAQLAENLEILKEKEEQLKEYRKVVRKIEIRKKKDIKEINEIYSDHYEGWQFSDRFINSTLRRFLDLLPKYEIEDALYIAISRFLDDEDRSIRYFCGICWNKIRSKNESEEH